MRNNINVWSFILSLCCIPLFFIAATSTSILSFFTKVIGIHPLDMVLGVTVITFFLGLIGLKNVREWKAMARSIFTIIFTIGFLIVLIYIIFTGRLLR